MRLFDWIKRGFVRTKVQYKPKYESGGSVVYTVDPFVTEVKITPEVTLSEGTLDEIIDIVKKEYPDEPKRANRKVSSRRKSGRAKPRKGSSTKRKSTR